MLELPMVAKVISGCLPFMIVANGPQTVNKTRVIEAVITAIIVGIVVAYAGMYIALPVVQERLESLRASVVELKADVKARAEKIERSQAETDAKIVQLQIELAKRR